MRNKESEKERKWDRKKVRKRESFKVRGEEKKGSRLKKN